MRDLRKKWREDRQYLWDHKCNKKGTKEDNYKLKPKRINEIAWENFINYRMGKEIKTISEQNKKNRDEQKIYHTYGSKSFLAKSKELMEVEKFMANPETQLDIGPNDVVGRAFKGKEHPGRVR
ncbi:hypothetical protein LINGRAHAP2_LOCUS23274, partial [Linum grandiflorum]